MPAKGKLAERSYDAAETKAIESEAAARGIAAADIRRLLGETTLDIYLNGTAYWRNIPRNVWEYYIGGYQVIKKWLSYREDEILGRALKPEEAREVTKHGPAASGDHLDAARSGRKLPAGEGGDLCLAAAAQLHCGWSRPEARSPWVQPYSKRV